MKTKAIAFANISDPVAGLFIHLDLEKKTAIVTHHSNAAAIVAQAVRGGQTRNQLAREFVAQ